MTHQTHDRYTEIFGRFNPFTPKNDRSKNSPAASPAIFHNTVWRIWLFMACSDERWLYYQFSLPHVCICLWEDWENALFELGSERVNCLVWYGIRNCASFWGDAYTVRQWEINFPTKFQECITMIKNIIHTSTSMPYEYRKVRHSWSTKDISLSCILRWSSSEVPYTGCKTDPSENWSE